MRCSWRRWRQSWLLSGLPEASSSCPHSCPPNNQCTLKLISIGSSGSKENEQAHNCPSRMELIEVMCKREIGCVNCKFKNKVLPVAGGSPSHYRGRPAFLRMRVRSAARLGLHRVNPFSLSMLARPGTPPGPPRGLCAVRALPPTCWHRAAQVTARRAPDAKLILNKDGAL